MRFLVGLLLVILSGCSSDALSAESRLNAYAAVASDREQLAHYLTGAALDSALASLDLMDELGLQSKGQSIFSSTKPVAAELFSSCLDVSGTEFFSTSGEPIALDRTPRQTVQVQFDTNLISDIELTGETC